VRRIALGFAALAMLVACGGFTTHVGGLRRSGEYQRTIWALGDSLTLGSLETSPGVYDNNQGGYRTRLYSDFSSREKIRYSFVGTLNNGPGGPTLPDGDHDGHAGWWTADHGNMLVSAGTGVEDVLSHVSTWMITIGHVDIVVILIGANSVKHCYANDTSVSDPGYPIFSYAVPGGATVGACWSGYIGANPSGGTIFAFQNDAAGAFQHTADEVIEVVDAVATGCAGKCLEVVVNVLPQVGYVNTIAEVNARISAGLAGRSNAHWLATPSITTSDLGTDETHLTATGYQKLGDAIYAALP
jgi:lysophospholipase L1-like esterase